MTIEECLKFLVDKIGIETSDKGILSSISRQVSLGKALTDRQCALVKSKLLLFKEDFAQHNIDIEFYVSQGELLQPLRVIDRSKYIKIVDTAEVYADMVYESYKQNWQWIKVRFPFAKKHILKINKIVLHHREYVHKKGSHEHYYKLTETNIKKVLNQFINSSFDIDPKLLKFYNEILEIDMNTHAPVFVDNEFKNVSNVCKDLIDKEIGSIDKLKIFDRKRRFGLTNVDCVLPNNLAGKIAQRDNSVFLNKPSEHSLDEVAEALLLLNRFPLLVLIDSGKELDQLSSVHNAFKHIIPNDKQTVLFRTENNDTGKLFNDYIHNNGLNNWLDNDIEIVYIKKEKLPKLLLKNEWQPLCVFCMTSDMPRKQVRLYAQRTDLVVQYDEELSLMGSFNGIL